MKNEQQQKKYQKNHTQSKSKFIMCTQRIEHI